MDPYNPMRYDPDVFTEYVPWKDLEVGTLYKEIMDGRTRYAVLQRELPNNFKLFTFPGMDAPQLGLRIHNKLEGMYFRRPREPHMARRHALMVFGKPLANNARRSRRARRARRRNTRRRRV